MKDTQSFQFDTVKGFKFGSWPFGRPKMYSHFYFVDGLLVDTGHRNMRKEVMKTIDCLPINQVFITHHHEDHTGNLKPIQEKLNCPTYTTSIGVKMMKNPPKISFAQWLTWGVAEANFELESVGDVIETPNHILQVIPTPGHAVDMACLYEPNEGWLFSADLFVREYIKFFMRSESMKQQIESIKNVLTLDFDVLFCGHNPQFKGGKKKLKQKLQFFEDFYGKASALYREGNSANEIMKKMRIKEDWQTRILSTGELSRLNMVKAVIRDIENMKPEIEPQKA